VKPVSSLNVVSGSAKTEVASNIDLCLGCVFILMAAENHSCSEPNIFGNRIFYRLCGPGSLFDIDDGQVGWPFANGILEILRT
jgi:hypothetical protein